MKKYLFILAASAALVACSKNELTPAASVADQEITYTVAPKVKVVETTPSFKTDWTFKSTAFYLDVTWSSTTAASSKEFIYDTQAATGKNAGVIIKHYDDAIGSQTANGVWRSADGKKYYWPKTGKLTFFAWTSLALTDITAAMGTATTSQTSPSSETVKPTETQSVSYISGVTVTNSDGVKITDYDVAANKNVDILVADIKADRQKNTTATYRNDGVPTLFHHKLSQVFFSAQTKGGYDYETKDGVTFTINSIKFVQIDSKGTYTQGVVNSDTKWTSGTPVDQTYYTSTTGTKVTITATPLVGTDGQQYYYLPQTFTAPTSGQAATEDYFVINYTIKYANGTTETIDKKCNLTDSFASWDMGKKYTINLKFALDEILWDPAVEDWTVANDDVTIQ